MSKFITKEGVDLMVHSQDRKAYAGEAIRGSLLCNGHEAPARYKRNSATGYNEMDTFVLYDTKYNTYMDAFGRCISDEDVKNRRALESKRILKAKAKKEAARVALQEAQKAKLSASPANKNGKELV